MFVLLRRISMLFAGYKAIRSFRAKRHQPKHRFSRR
jgi:hypothetical protein